MNNKWIQFYGRIASFFETVYLSIYKWFLRLKLIENVNIIQCIGVNSSKHMFIYLNENLCQHNYCKTHFELLLFHLFLRFSLFNLLNFSKLYNHKFIFVSLFTVNTGIVFWFKLINVLFCSVLLMVTVFHIYYKTVICATLWMYFFNLCNVEGTEYCTV